MILISSDLDTFKGEIIFRGSVNTFDEIALPRGGHFMGADTECWRLQMSAIQTF